MSEQVKKLESIEDLTGMARGNAALMSEVYNDEKMSVETRMKLFRSGVQNAISIRAEQRKTALDLARIGMKLNGQLEALTFEPAAKDSE